ncbi:MAG: tetratricopeptide repeat protein [Eubacteriales bacterium]|nr:tetratricopeptide repeat protein [Eubacteriales bacterium]
MRYQKLILTAALLLTLTGCRDRGPSALETARNAALEYMANAQYEAAVTELENAYQLCDEKMPQTKTDISLYEAACYLKLENYEQVRTVCTRILGLGENSDAYYMRGAAFLQLGEAEAAKADFDRSVQLDASNYELYLNIYQQYEAQNQSAIGDVYLQTALNIEGEETEDYYQKGCIYFYLKDYPRAQEALAVPVEQRYQKAMELMGEVYLAQGDTVHARNVYQQCIEAFGETAEAYNGIVLCDIADGAYDAAISDADAGLTLDGENGKRDLRYNQIVAYEKKLDFETAKAKAQEFAELYPEDEAGKKEYDFLITR